MVKRNGLHTKLPMLRLDSGQLGLSARVHWTVVMKRLQHRSRQLLRSSKALSLPSSALASTNLRRKPPPGWELGLTV